jgi:hypothetical protein
MILGKVSKFSITFILCTFPDSTPVSVRRVLQDYRLLKIESELTFCCHHGSLWSFGCYLCSMDEMLIRFSLVFKRWMTTSTPPLEPTDGSVVTGCTAPGFPPCSETCCTASATRSFPRTMAAHTVSLGWGTARSMWIFWLTSPTRPKRLGLPQFGVTTSMTLWRGLPTRPSWNSVSATYRFSATPPLPCSPFRTRATRCGVSVWLPSATPSFQPIMRVGRLPHATPSM